jgi:peptide/nickel transport system substrate-binding protein
MLMLSFANSESSIAASATEKIFVYARPVSKTIDPAPSCGDEEIQNSFMVYDQLVTLDMDLKVVPAVAKSWEVSSDYKTFTFHLRRDIKFHDGTLLTAEDVKFSFDRLREAGLQCIGAYTAMQGSAKVIDDYTVQLSLAEPYPNFVKDELENGAYSILSSKYVKDHATGEDPWALDWMTTHECGSGPFILEEWTPGDRMIFRKNSAYWNEGRMPKLDKVIFRIFKESLTARLWIERGEVDAAEKLTADDFEALIKNSDVNVKTVEPGYPLMIYLTMDVSKPPFNDMLVRKAIAYAINYKELISNVERGNAIAAHGMMPKGMVGYNEHPLPYRYEPVLAKQLMALSNHPDGFTTELLYTTERRAEFEQEAVYLQAYLKEIGIAVKPAKVSLATALNTCSKGNYGLSLRKWSAGLPSPDEMGGWFYDQGRDMVTGWIATFWMNDWAMSNMREARQTLDPEKREELYEDTDALSNELAIYVPLYQAGKRYAVRKGVQYEYSPNQFGRFYWADK